MCFIDRLADKHVIKVKDEINVTKFINKTMPVKMWFVHQQGT